MAFFLSRCMGFGLGRCMAFGLDWCGCFCRDGRGGFHLYRPGSFSDDRCRSAGRDGRWSFRHGWRSFGDDRPWGSNGQWGSDRNSFKMGQLFCCDFFNPSDLSTYLRFPVSIHLRLGQFLIDFLMETNHLVGQLLTVVSNFPEEIFKYLVYLFL